MSKVFLEKNFFFVHLFRERSQSKKSLRRFAMSIMKVISGSELITSFVNDP